MTPIINLFRDMTDAEIYVEGETIFHAGQAGEVMYIVQEGEVDLLVNGHWVETVGEGGVFGEMALVDSQPREVSAVARTNVQLVPIDADLFRDLLQESPDFGLQVMSTMADRLRYMHELYQIAS
ncbi:MAG: cyclic nucleotide-binding domain-containing protein [Anaerolineae bacterium]|nr:cyclic nucleotide-binding domain-containing protein [Anaerolineae bacterium]